MSMVNIAMEILKNQGFKNIKSIDHDTSNISVFKPISVIDLDGASNFTIVPLDATATQEFQDLIYVAIEEKTNNLLEAACISKAPKIYNEQEAESQLKQRCPGVPFEIIPGHFWKSELRSFLTTVRRFKTCEKEMFLLPNGETTDHLDEFTMGA